MASKASSVTSGNKKAAGTRNNATGRDKAASEGSGVLLIAGGVLAAAYLFFSATGYLGEMLGKALFGLIGLITYALPVILIAVGVIYIRGASNERLNGSGWYLLLSILALVTLFSTARNSLTEGMEYMTYINEALSVGQNAHLGGGFVGAVLSYLLLKLGGPTLFLYFVLLVVVDLSDQDHGILPARRLGSADAKSTDRRRKHTRSRCARTDCRTRIAADVYFDA